MSSLRRARRSSGRPLLVLPLLALLLGGPAGAQDATLPDGGEDAGVDIPVPDASVGSGGGDRGGQEGDDATGRGSATCTSTVDCNPGFGCKDGRCVYTGVRDAELGCGSGTPLGLAFLGAAVLLARRGRG